MSVRVIQGNMFRSELQTLTCTVNVVGVMGKGIALEFRKRYPDLFNLYRKEYRFHYDPDTTDPDNRLIHTLRTHRITETGRQCLLFPTKKHWKRPSQLEWVDTNLKILAKTYEELGITSLALPALGCSNGQLNFRDVLPLIEEHLNPLPIPIELYY